MTFRCGKAVCIPYGAHSGKAHVLALPEVGRVIVPVLEVSLTAHHHRR